MLPLHAMRLGSSAVLVWKRETKQDLHSAAIHWHAPIISMVGGMIQVIWYVASRFCPQASLFSRCTTVPSSRWDQGEKPTIPIHSSPLWVQPMWLNVHLRLTQDIPLAATAATVQEWTAGHTISHGWPLCSHIVAWSMQNMQNLSFHGFFRARYINVNASHTIWVVLLEILHPRVKTQINSKNGI